jgi:NAD(P)-dependent dehydrogenase (short-subunit alcohol dehydrogenase family)
VRLHLSVRDGARLEAVAEACRAQGATVQARVIDVRNAPAMATWIGGAGRLDLVIANAGVAGRGLARAERTRLVFATNLDGVLNTVLPAWEAMRAQPAGPDGLRGHIAVIASIAAFVPIPGAAAYAAAKAAVDSWTVASARDAAADGIRLVSLCPGYVRTRMTRGNTFPMPGLMDADRAARLILRGIESGRVRVVFPRWFGLGARLVGLLPPRVLHWLEPRGPDR